ncbi:hypothetical protein [Neorhizobium alkalisoli]|uniref:hypothetical protein n=1 Tax=Neorhizobium alkalisoli TaxID=528178 RepID=UPI0014728389|nr:hypothetical protein [Neorhizobium alkalisoli]
MDEPSGVVKTLLSDLSIAKKDDYYLRLDFNIVDVAEQQFRQQYSLGLSSVARMALRVQSTRKVILDQILSSVFSYCPNFLRKFNGVLAAR